MIEETAATIAAYDKRSKEFIEKYENASHLIVQYLPLFFDHLQGKKIADLGCGPGAHAEMMVQAGYDVDCVDLSDEMLQECKRKGLNTIKADLLNLQLQPNTYDGLWMIASLPHVPKKHVPAVAKRLAEALKPDGVLLVGVRLGEGEQFFDERFYSYYATDELIDFFSPYFSVLKSWELSKPHPFTYVFLKKQERHS